MIRSLLMSITPECSSCFFGSAPWAGRVGRNGRRIGASRSKGPMRPSETKDRFRQAERSGTDLHVPIWFTAGLPAMQENIVHHSGLGLEANPAYSWPAFIGANGK
jgi:hypothetical protein